MSPATRLASRFGALVVICGCGADPAGSPPTAVELERNPHLAMQRAIDVNPDPRVFETEIVARVENVEIAPGYLTATWTYDGQVPGPLIELSRGDKLIVHFRNQLPEATTIHWHGIRLPNEMDGVPEMTQAAVEPGGSFDYEFVLPDAGTYWYHPHLRSAAQVGFGLYGALVVNDPDEPAELGEAFTMVLSDAALEDDGTLSAPDQSGDLGTLFGREGNVVLLNGKQDPILYARRGERQRWRLINAAKSRYFQLAAEGHRFLRIGGDGGFAAAPIDSDRLVLTPGERADVLFTLDAAAPSELPIRWVPFERGFGSTEFRTEISVFRIAATDEPPLVPPPLPEVSRAIEPLDLRNAASVSMALTETITPTEFWLGVDGLPGWQTEPLMARVGDTQVWTIFNDMSFSHPFHLHGFFFQVLEVNGVAPTVLEWKDTANLPLDGSMSLAVRFDERPGMWMFHCHILDHADAGMMRMLHLHP
jgi:FtsP/CotA-like multicopper oxidase with cupredoxin domain